MNYEDEATRARRLRREALQEELRRLDAEERSSVRSAQRNLQSTSVVSNPVPSTGPNYFDDTRNINSTASGSRSQNSAWRQSYTPETTSREQWSSSATGLLPVAGSFSMHLPNPTASRSSSSASNPQQFLDTVSNPYGSTPLPSREQVHDYLVSHRGQSRGLKQKFSIEGRSFDPYALFAEVVKAGGSERVTKRNWWPIIAGLLNFPTLPPSTQPGLRSSDYIGTLVQSFFKTMLRGLEELWDQTQVAPMALFPSPVGTQPSHSPLLPESAQSIQMSPGNIVGTEPIVTPRLRVPSANHAEWASGSAFGHSEVAGMQSVHNPPSSQIAPPSASWHMNPLPTPITSSQMSSAFRQPQTSFSERRDNQESRVSATMHESRVIYQPTPSYPHTAGVPTRLNRQAEKENPHQFKTLPSPHNESHLPNNSSFHQNDTTAPTQPTSTQPQPSSQSKARPPSSSPSLSTGNLTAGLLPPEIKDFTQFVSSNILPLPKAGEGVNIDPTAYDPVTYYSLRCHELRHAAIKMREKSGKPRQMTDEEMWFWNKLVVILNKNRSIAVPGVDHLSRGKIQTAETTTASSKANALLSTIPSTDSESKVIGKPDTTDSHVTINTTLTDGAKIAKKRGRPRKSLEDVGPKRPRAPSKKKSLPSVTEALQSDAGVITAPLSQPNVTSSAMVSSQPSQVQSLPTTALASFKNAGSGPSTMTGASTSAVTAHSTPGRITNSSTPAADLMRLFLAKQVSSMKPMNVSAESSHRTTPSTADGTKQSGTPNGTGSTNGYNLAQGGSPSWSDPPPPSTPINVVSSSPKTRIHLSTGRPSIAHISKKDETFSQANRTPVAAPEPRTSTTQLKIDSYNLTEIRPARISRARYPVDRAKVILPIKRRRRALLIQRGYYNSFRDDDSDDGLRRRKGHTALRPTKILLPKNSQARFARPKVPEEIPLRFLSRPGPGIIEPFKTILQESIILRRSCEYDCEWKGCDAVLASEWHLKKHVEFRNHAAQGKFQAGPWGQETFYRCHWRGCEQPCFLTEADLNQHLVARHISRNLRCPFNDCDLTSPTISHLSRHVMKQHDDPSDVVRPLADLSEKLPPPFPIPDTPLSTAARTDELTTPEVRGTVYRSAYRQEWLRQRIQINCFAGDDPVIHVTHPPHILQPLEHEEGSVSVPASLETGMTMEREEDLLGKVLGRKKKQRMVVVVEIPVRKWPKLGQADF